MNTPVIPAGARERGEPGPSLTAAWVPDKPLARLSGMTILAAAQ